MRSAASTGCRATPGLGCALDGWSKHFNYAAWIKAFSDCGLDPSFYASRARGYAELLPWELSDIGVTRAYLKMENERALRAETTMDCREGCVGCGLRRFDGVCPE